MPLYHVAIYFFYNFTGFLHFFEVFCGKCKVSLNCRKRPQDSYFRNFVPPQGFHPTPGISPREFTLLYHQLSSTYLGVWRTIKLKYTSETFYTFQHFTYFYSSCYHPCAVDTCTYPTPRILDKVGPFLMDFSTKRDKNHCNSPKNQNEKL